MVRFARRELLGAAACAALLPSSSWADPREPIVEVSGADRAAMVRAAFEALGGVSSFVKRGSRVAIKPNLAFANPPEWATTTHPETLSAVCRACLDAGAREILVVEHPLADPNRCLERNGSGAVLAALPSVGMRMLSEREEFQEVPVPHGLTLKDVAVAKALLEADVVINLPQAKHHGSAGASFGLKNLMGAIWSRKPFHIFHDLHEAIVDTARVVPAHLTLLDATHVLLSGGPKGPGEVARTGKLFAGRAMASVDALCFASTPLGKKASLEREARHISLAGTVGLGETAVSRLLIKRVSV